MKKSLLIAALILSGSIGLASLSPPSQAEEGPQLRHELLIDLNNIRNEKSAIREQLMNPALSISEQIALQARSNDLEIQEGHLIVRLLDSSLLIQLGDALLKDTQ